VHAVGFSSQSDPGNYQLQQALAHGLHTFERGLSALMQPTPSCAAPRSNVGALTLRTEQDQQLDRAVIRSGETVRNISIEFGGFAGSEGQVLLAEDQPQPPVEDAEPFVASWVRGSGVSARRRAGMMIL
jgi:hypothetical protein